MNFSYAQFDTHFDHISTWISHSAQKEVGMWKCTVLYVGMLNVSCSVVLLGTLFPSYSLIHPDPDHPNPDLQQWQSVKNNTEQMDQLKTTQRKKNMNSIRVNTKQRKSESMDYWQKQWQTPITLNPKPNSTRSLTLKGVQGNVLTVTSLFRDPI